MLEMNRKYGKKNSVEVLHPLLGEQYLYVRKL